MGGGIGGDDDESHPAARAAGGVGTWGIWGGGVLGGGIWVEQNRRPPPGNILPDWPMVAASPTEENLLVPVPGCCTVKPPSYCCRKSWFSPAPQHLDRPRALMAILEAPLVGHDEPWRRSPFPHAISYDHAKSVRV